MLKDAGFSRVLSRFEGLLRVLGLRLWDFRAHPWLGV